jgi:hypothetical protein
LAGEGVGGEAVDGEECADLAEVVGGLVGRSGGGRDPEAAADGLGFGHVSGLVAVVHPEAFVAAAMVVLEDPAEWHAHAMCMYAERMTIAIQIKDVPEEVRDVLAERAAERGQSTQQYLRGLLEREYRRERNKRLFENMNIKRGTSMPIDEMVDFIRSGRD